MAYIYKITNKCNNKIYIGKTIETLANRFSKHKWDALNKPQTGSHLHNAMVFYGIDNFIIELVEECNHQILSEREKYWIAYYNSYNKEIGYNNTLGGEGNLKYDYDYILELWNKNYTQKDIANILGCDKHVISKALRTNNISETDRQKWKYMNSSKSVAMIDKHTNEIIKIFLSAKEAAQFFGKSNQTNITKVCRNEGKTAYGYKWKYINN